VPYRIDFIDSSADVLDRLVVLGALDIEKTPGGVAALMPDTVDADGVAARLGIERVAVSPAVGRDSGSTWVLTLRPLQRGRLLILPAHATASPGALTLIDSPAFGSGLHPTTGLCLELLDRILTDERPARVLDVGTGSGVLALAALKLGVRQAVALDVDCHALNVAAVNARVNGLSDRFHLVAGGPEAVGGAWPLVVANILTAPLIELAPAIVRRVASRGRLVLSGIAKSTAVDLENAYERFGLHTRTRAERGGWCGIVFEASW
jgi:ribosomal protein L11 methyltransferase